MDDESNDEASVRALDRAWNEGYVHNDRTGFAEILADDFLATSWSGQTITKAQLMMPAPAGKVTFSEHELRMCGPTAITRGRIRVELAADTIEQRFVRIYSKRNDRWQAVAVQVFPIA